MTGISAIQTRKLRGETRENSQYTNWIWCHEGGKNKQKDVKTSRALRRAFGRGFDLREDWIPAYAGMTLKGRE